MLADISVLMRSYIVCGKTDIRKSIWKERLMDIVPIYNSEWMLKLNLSDLADLPAKPCAVYSRAA